MHNLITFWTQMPGILGFIKRKHRKEVMHMYGNNYPNDFDDNINNTQGIYSSYQNVPPVPPVPEKKKKEHKLLKKLAIAAGVGMCFGVFAGAGFYSVKSTAELLGIGQQEKSAVETQAPVQQQGDIESSNVVSTNNANAVTTVTTDVTGVVKQAMPSIVAITNMYTDEYNFFGQKMESPNEASGSGIIVGENDTELLVVTNQHVIAGADELSVQFIDGEQVKAKVKGYDSEKDLAVIAVALDEIKSSTREQIVIASLGDSDNLTVGEPAIAIGNALGYGQSVTTGVISALDRELGDSSNKLIQTDAAINPGNSGGALINSKGEVIGINSSKYSDTAVEGMGFAIPMATAKPILEDLIANGKTTTTGTPYLGIYGVDVTDEVSENYNMPKGVYIAQVVKGGGAELAGLKVGNIITAVNGEEVASMEELKGKISICQVGDTVKLTVLTANNGSYDEAEIEVKLSSQQNSGETSQSQESPENKETPGDEQQAPPQVSEDDVQEMPGEGGMDMFPWGNW